MTIHSYFEHVEGRDPEPELRLILLWRAHHATLGIETKVLSEYQAAKSKHYPQFVEAIEKLVANGPGRPTFMRWLAMCRSAGGRGVMMDYDTFLYPVVWDDTNPIFQLSGADVQTLRFYQGTRPSLVIGTEETFERQAMRFASCEIKDPPADLTDETILRVQAEKLPETMNCMNYIQDYGSPDWQTAVAVKYPRAMENDGRGARWQSIPLLRKQVIPQ